MVKHEIKKITHYEYWPFWIFYAPMLLIWLYYSLKAKSFTYFTAVNPGLEYGGFFDYSKFKIQEQIQADLIPKHQLIKSNQANELKFDFPFIAKPDMGERGKHVLTIQNEKQWNIYQNKVKSNIIAQEFIDLPEEYGIFYAKMPNQKQGNIISITGKKFLTYVGDGKMSLREFIESDSRAYFNKSYLYMKYHTEQNLILPEGEKIVLENIGNHSRGTYFYDHSDLITPNLEQTIHQAVDTIDGFYYGRLDVKAKSDEALQKGEFIIIEVNGANSEPTHIYDENFTIIQAYKEVIRHLKIEYIIAKNNIKNGTKPTPLGQFIPILHKHIIG